MAALSVSESVQGDLKCVRYSVTVDGERVPGVAWMPVDLDEPAPLVFIQHPATSSKDDYFVTGPAQQWAMRGWICGGIDAPMHGDRANFDPMGLFRERERYPEIARQFADELHATVEGLIGQYPVDVERMGYVGFSMGSMLGVPAVAKDGRFKAAAFCLVGEGGLTGPAAGPESHVPGLAGVAVRIVGKTADELISREATESLYQALEGEKDLVWLPGGHFEIGGDVIAKAEEWMKRHLS